MYTESIGPIYRYIKCSVYNLLNNNKPRSNYRIKYEDNISLSVLSSGLLNSTFLSNQPLLFECSLCAMYDHKHPLIVFLQNFTHHVANIREQFTELFTSITLLIVSI